MTGRVEEQLCTHLPERNIIDHRHPALPFLPEGIFIDQACHEVAYIDPACLSRIEDRIAHRRRMKGVTGHLVLIDKTIGAHCHPFNSGMVLPDMLSQVIGGLLIIGMGR
jgi:hypothetical protein